MSSHWAMLYLENQDMEDDPLHFEKQFRTRFRLPHQSFLDLAEKVKAHSLFKRWARKDATGHVGSPIELLLLGTLRYLGRGWYFDDLSEATFISHEVHRTFFHTFIKYGSTVLYREYVRYPKNADKASSTLGQYKAVALPGAAGSTDATHIASENSRTTGTAPFSS